MTDTVLWTLASFIASGHDSDDLRADVEEGAEFWDDDVVIAPVGRVYANRWWIERVMPHWPVESQNRGAWCLTVGNEITISDDLPMLERRLFECVEDGEL
jgi:hypothetical protein